MTFKEFQEYIEAHILEGWKEDYKVELRKIRKNNGVELCGMFIRKEGDLTAPAIYLEDYYPWHLKGERTEKIIEKIRKAYDWMVPQLPSGQLNVSHFECVRDRIVYRLVNYEKNKEILEECPYLRLHDLALTFRWVAHSDEIGISTALITNKELDAWGVTMHDILLAAKDNTERLFPPCVMEIAEVFQKIAEKRAQSRMASGMRSIMESGMESFPEFTPDSDIEMYIMTNEQGVNGAGVILYDDYLKNFAREHDEDFYILPSSIHEMILVPAGNIDSPSGFFEMVRDVNETVVSLGDILSDSVYYYDRKENRIIPLKQEEYI